MLVDTCFLLAHLWLSWYDGGDFMATNILTKSGIDFSEIRIFKTIVTDDLGKQTTKWLVNVGYKVVSAEGESYNKDKQIELSGTKLTTASSFFDSIKSQILAEEGI